MPSFEQLKLQALLMLAPKAEGHRIEHYLYSAVAFGAKGIAYTRLCLHSIC